VQMCVDKKCIVQSTLKIADRYECDRSDRVFIYAKSTVSVLMGLRKKVAVTRNFLTGMTHHAN
jgi:hypothetical protein